MPRGVLSEVLIVPQPVAEILPWRERDNVIVVVAGSFLVDLQERA